MKNLFRTLSVFLGCLFLAVVLVAFHSFSVSAQGKSREHIPVCPGPAGNDNARCHARVVVDRQGNPDAGTLPSGYGPSQFHTGYNLPATTSVNQTIAIVDAYNHPNILSDLNTYSNTFGIPPMQSCPVSSGTVSSPCFQKVDQNGGTFYPQTNAGWALEIALDVEAAHAMCQNCNILLVEAASNSYTNLMTAVDRARIMGAKIISNSYGSGEFSGENTFDSHFNFPDMAITFSSGDSGYGAEYPASSPYVVSVGGTTLNLNASNNWLSETVWNGSGSGCSVYESVKPAGQPTIAGCTHRIVADVSADADPSTGAAVYDSVKYFGRRGWFQVGGTSLAAPLVAGVYALAGGVPSGVYGNTIPYSQFNYSTNLHDITSGSTSHCDGTSLCVAVPNYDGSSGLGTPNGTGAF